MPSLDIEGEKDSNIVVDFKNVSFAYPTRPMVTVLKNVSLQISRGQTVAIVGSSGSGKSTLLALLECFYDVQSGSLNVFGKSVQSLEVDALRKRLALVPQEPTLYRGKCCELLRRISQFQPDKYICRINSRQHYAWC